MAHPHETRILRVSRRIHAISAGDLLFDALADVATMLCFHWQRVFRGMTGETLARTVGRQRPHHPPPPTIKGVKMISTITIRNDPARSVAAIAHRGPYQQIGAAFEKVSAIMAARDLFAHVRGMVGVYHDDPKSTESADLRSHAGFLVEGAPALDAPLETIQLATGRYAVLLHKGPYWGLPAAYDELFARWLPTSGEEPADAPTFENYLNSPMDTAPEDLLTEICVPLK